MEKLTLGLSTTVTGMLVVFGGLLILIGCIYLMTLFTARPKKEAPRPLPVITPIVPVREMTAEQPAADSEEQAVAAITAAIAMIWRNEGRESGFVVRRVRRVSASSARARAAREDQIYSRM